MQIGQWFALPKLFEWSKNEGYEIVRSDDEVIQFKNEQSWRFKILPKTATINALVTLSLDPATRDSDFMQIKYHKDQVCLDIPLCCCFVAGMLEKNADTLHKRQTKRIIRIKD